MIIIITLNHKLISLLYFQLSCIFLVIGYILSINIRIEISVIGYILLLGDYQMYNVYMTFHGLIMIFSFVMPIFLGSISNMFIPIIFRIPELIYPRLNNIGCWLFIIGNIIIIIALYIEDGCGCGWTLYPSLTLGDFHSSSAIDILIPGFHITSLASIINIINVLGTIYKSRCILLMFIHIYKNMLI